MKKERVKLALVASGSGTDARAIMAAWQAGRIPEVESIVLISTKADAGCLIKAKEQNVPAIIVNYADFKREDNKQTEFAFNIRLRDTLLENNVNLVFLVGCIKRITTFSSYYSIYNIHPADPVKHGGNEMYGLAVHMHVLDEIADFIYRGRATETDRFFTYPTIHEVTGDEYDVGKILIQAAVEIPGEIIKDWRKSDKNSESVAKCLQQHVLPKEWVMLPLAVQLAARRIIEQGGV